jgi:hypothetical protein
MAVIYTRADTVLVWLTPNSPNVDSEELEVDVVNNEYWTRVWIIQEVGKARRLSVYEGRKCSDWNEFFRGKFGVVDQNSPMMKLATLRKRRHADGALLQALLEAHEGALCKDPHDKIYGLVGMSVDGDGRLPMDYRKSLWEVYKDVILLHKSKRDYSNFFSLSKLLKRMIGGPENIPTKVLEADKVSSSLWALYNEDLIPVNIQAHRGDILGHIVYLGPGLDEIISNPEEAYRWTRGVEQYLGSKSNWAIREQNDLFLQVLENVNRDELELRLSTRRNARRLTPVNTAQPQSSVNMEQHGPASRDSPNIVGHSFLEEIVKFSLDYINPLNYVNFIKKYGAKAGLLKTVPRLPLFLVKTKGNKTFLGIACKEAKVGDVICQFPGNELALVAKTRGYHFTCIGCAGLALGAESAWRQLASRKEPKTLFGFAKPEQRFWNPWTSDKSTIFMDLFTLYEISD